MQPWHAMPPSAVLRALATSETGLTTSEAGARLAQLGPNTIPIGSPASTWRVLLSQFRSVVTLLLVGALIIAALTGDVVDTFAIAAVLVLNVALGFAVEIRARRAIEALAELEPRVAVVARDGVTREIDAQAIVPGDLLVLEAGQGVPADARMLAGEIEVNEAALTGESVPVWKLAAAAVAPDTSLPDRSTMVHGGTLVVAGSGRAVVVATGRATELGTIGGLVAATHPRKTPLEAQLDVLGQQLVWAAMLIAIATGILAWVNGGSLPLVLESAIALAVAAVPEGLPAVATITLALAVHRMARRHALVRRLPVVETLGSVTVLCTDKTGTLTAGEMTASVIHTCDHVYEVTGVGYQPVGAFTSQGHDVDPPKRSDLQLALETGIAAGRGDIVLAEQGWVPRGDPTEVALAVAAMKAGIHRSAVTDGMPELGDVPFSSERQLMAIFHRCPSDGRTRAFVKGAPHRVLDLCWSVFSCGASRPLNAATRRHLKQMNADMAARGLRVLALAAGDVTHPDERSLLGLTFVALVGISDPPAAGVKEAIASFRRSGIRTVMLTGDQRGTAEAVARQLELDGDPHALTGDEIDALSDADLERRANTTTVFSRVSPAAKLRLVSAYQRQGEVVAMIGDGVNDAAALKRADVGVTMGRRGTEVARDTATIVLTDDRFETIGAAIGEGRLVFENIRRFVFYLFSCNLAEIIVLLGTSAAGWPLPLAPIQVLWLNLVTDSVPALALAVEPARGDLMQQPPRRPTEALLSRDFLHGIGLYAVLLAVPALGVIVWQTMAGVWTPRAMTLTFAVLGLAQLFHLGNARDEGPVWHWRRAVANRAALIALAVGVVSMLAVVQIPALARLLQLTPLHAADWLLVTVLALIPAVVGQVVKSMRMRTTMLALFALFALATTVQAQSITGQVQTITVPPGATLRSLGARFGVEAATIAKDNGRPLEAPLKAGETLRIDNRHIVPPAGAGVAIVVNVPQRILFAAIDAGITAYPVAVGRATWPTPLGDFSITVTEPNPTWDVPESIREEARRSGRSLPLKVPPGPNNPLGAFWLGTSLGGVGIHGTNAPTSIYQHVTHGCIRLHPEDIASLFTRVQVGTRGVLLYQPVLVTVQGDLVFLEVHRDVYKRGPQDPLEYVRARARELGVFDRVDWTIAAEVIRQRAGIARTITR